MLTCTLCTRSNCTEETTDMQVPCSQTALVPHNMCVVIHLYSATILGMFASALEMASRRAP